MNGLPLLSIMTWAPFVSAIVIMFVARHRPLLVRLTALVGASVSLIASLWLYYAYDRSAVAGTPGQLSIAMITTTGFGAGEFVTVNADIATGTNPKPADFTAALVGNVITPDSVVIPNVAVSVVLTLQ